MNAPDARVAFASPAAGARPVLGIETSCDESAVAIFGAAGLLAHRLHSQVDLHARYGGVVPELASRDHILRLPALVREVLAEAGLAPRELGGIAYTAGPGLIGALMAGGATASGLAVGLGVGLIPVHHMEGHLLAPLLEDPAPAFPFTALLVSGGHTLLVGVAGLGDYTLLGESLDDAAGEAFDKTAKLLGLPYPGGPRLARLAEEGRPGVCRFPRPMLDRPGLDFSFSGLKTAAATALAKLPGPDAEATGQGAPTPADLARGFEDAVVETLVEKCRRALGVTGHRRLVVAGGVGANRRLRAALAAMVAARGATAFFPRLEFCTDNAAMIALAGWHRRGTARAPRAGFTARARWPLVELRPPGAAPVETPVTA